MTVTAFHHQGEGWSGRRSDPRAAAGAPAGIGVEVIGQDGTRGAMRDEQGFVAFYQATHRRLVKQVFVIVRSVPEAEDIAQEAFIRAAAHWDRISDYDAPEAWVRRVAVNLATNAVERTRRRARILMGMRREDAVPGPSVERIALVDALAELPLRYRVVLALHYFADLSVEQVADELGLPAATVRTRLVRGRRRLAELLAEGADLEEVRDARGNA